MKIDMSHIQLNQEGSVTITIDDLEDFWTLANIIHIDDIVFTPILRKVTKVSATGKSDTRKILTKAAVKITEIDYQPGVNEMQLRGVLTHDVEDARAGSFQRILLEIGRPFTLTKECWDQMSFEELSEAANPISHASVAAVVMQSGLAHICIVGRNTTVVCEKVSKAIPKVKVQGSASKSAEAKLKFFEMTAGSLVRNVKIDDMKCIIVASPGFLSNEFVSFLRDRMTQYDLMNAFTSNKFVTGNVPSGFPQELESLLAQPQMQAHVSQLKAATQARIMDQLLKTMNDSPDLTMFGAKNCIEAAAQGSVKILLVTDRFVSNQDQEHRLKFIELKNRISEQGTEVVMFSSRHQSGERLNELGGIAAILKYSIAIDDVDEDEPADFD